MYDDIPTKKISKALHSRGFHTFTACDWSRLGLQIDRIGQGLELTRSGAEAKFARGVILGWASEHGVRFSPSSEVEIHNPAIKRDYCDELANCPNLKELLIFLRRVGLRSFLRNFDSQFLVEIIEREFENTEGIPPHLDGTCWLFFLVLNNTMTGGALSLYSAKNATAQGVMRDGTHWYDKESATVVAQLPCIKGSGYLIAEGNSTNGETIFHGCAPWLFGPGLHNQRKSLRVAFYRRPREAAP